MRPDYIAATERRAMADELDRLFREVKEAGDNLRRAELRYKRQALWIKADELRKELARVENEAATIKL